MKALVTGGAGFIGSNLVDVLIKIDMEVVVIDDLSTGKLENLNSGAMFYKESIVNFGIVNRIVDKEKPDIIFHLAAWPRVPRSIKDPLGTNRVNVEGTLNLLQAARLNKVKNFIYSSSSSVYGKQKVYKMKENLRMYPMSPYALQKLMGEQYCSVFARLFGIRAVSLRYFNVYGKRQVTEGAYSLVIGKFMQQKREGKKMTIYGDGKQTRAYTHISDVVRANILAMEYRDLEGFNMCVNIGTDVETSVNEIASMIGGEVEYINPNPRGNFEEKRKCADYKRAKVLLEWKPLVDIKTGIQMVKNEENKG